MKLMQFHDFYVYQYFLRQPLDDLKPKVLTKLQSIISVKYYVEQKVLTKEYSNSHVNSYWHEQFALKYISQQ